MRHIKKIYEIFDTSSEKEFDKEQIRNLTDIFQELSDEFLGEIEISIKRNADSTEISYYSIDINYSKLLFYAYHYKRTNNIKDRSIFIDKMCDYSLKLSKFWKILNECLNRIKNEYTFDDVYSSSPLDDSCFFGENIKIIIACEK
jgi:hypothetical protein